MSWLDIFKWLLLIGLLMFLAGLLVEAIIKDIITHKAKVEKELLDHENAILRKHGPDYLKGRR